MGGDYNKKNKPMTKTQKLIYSMLCPFIVGFVVYLINLIEGEPFQLEVALPIMIGVSIPQWVGIWFLHDFYWRKSSNKEGYEKKNQGLRYTTFWLFIISIVLFIILYFS
ncbi:hypothetical protein [Natribacillus halophilus]|uniref:Uncharacterized protein n=1 Tax=Natribacillus halophilus TaxID=549003 RepID=A0A1G8SWI4_9BACI|nr:hypothetical protein [Natribacillus halophilus]SDJ33642.1 hypothetical protein SAMN04488123_1386 [Natribacillus halophilus]